MENFALEIIRANQKRQDYPVLTDKCGARTTDWSEFYEDICKVAAYAVKEGLSGVVPVCMDRGLEAFTSILGLNLAGVGVAPLSVATPESRLNLISGLTGNSLWTLETWEISMGAAPDFSLAEKENNAEPAYVVFTSGSTGVPKGVQLSNRAVIAEMKRMAGPDYYGLEEGGRMLQHGSLSFIALVQDMMAPLYAGCEIFVLPEEGKGDIRIITDYINRFKINYTFLSPQLYRLFDGAPSLKCMIIGSDKIVNIGPKGHRLVAAYGMSETAGPSFHYDITEPESISPIGEPSPEFNSYVLDESGNPSEEGELCISGAIAGGYMNLPEETAAAFTENPWSDDPEHGILLHTGDIVRRDPRKGLLYLNRKDNMVKVNGQRVEPGEIETAIKKIDAVKDIAVKGFTDDNGRGYLCAYYVSDREIGGGEFREELGKHLPPYMVPAFYTRLESLPINANGKLNRMALTAPESASLCGEYEEPASGTEVKLCRAFEIALRIDRIGANDDFISLGGDSILATSVVELADIPGLRATDVLSGGTPRRIASLISRDADGIYKNLPSGIERTALTDSQMGIYLECMQRPESLMYNIPFHITVPRNGLTPGQAGSAIDSVIAVHPALTARLESEDGIISMVRCPMPECGICRASETDGEGLSEALKSFIRPFNLFESPLCRVQALLTEKDIHILLDSHHIIVDGSSVNILARQFCDALAGSAPQAERTDAFALYSVEERYAAQQDEARRYFSSLLAGVETDSNLLPDMKPSDDKSPSRHLITRLDGLDLSGLKKNNITKNSFFMSVFAYTLAKMTGQSASLFATVESGRKSSLTASTVSMMVRTLPVVAEIDESKPASVLMKSLQQQFHASMRNDSCSFGELVREYGINSDVMFVYQSDMLADFDSSMGRVSVDYFETGDAFANLSVAVFKDDKGYRLNTEYRSDIYSPATMRRFAETYAKAAAAFAADMVLNQICLISEEDKAFLDRLNDNALAYDSELTIVDAFRINAGKNPDKTLVVCGDKSYTYGQVDIITDALAAYISAMGIGREQAVSVLIPRNEYMVIASLGIMKAGAMYQPLDPTYPAERLNFMCRDAAVRLVIADRSLAGILSETDAAFLFTDEIPDLPKAEKLPEPPKSGDGYILLYTSGTTGTPKGCKLTHANLTAFAREYAELTGMDENTVDAVYPSYGFDAHMADIYPAIFNCGQLHIVQDSIRLDLPALKNYFESNGITNTVMTTQVCRQFVTEYSSIKGMKCIVTGGEKLVSCAPDGNYRLLNCYGPTECTVMATYFHVDREYDDIPIGKAVPNTKLYVVDSNGRRVPVGVPGELIICGPQVAPGYLNRPEQTEKVFVPNTFEETVPEGYERCYRTGDIVRFADDGNICFIGRRDMQVKIRGFRIELGEVERIIRAYPGISDATVVARDDPAGGKCIHAYVVSNNKVDISSLNSFIRSEKPAYMVPAATMQIASIPLTPNFKVDKRKLPPIETMSAASSGDSGRSMTSIEKSLSEMLSDIVGHSNFGVETEFTDAGISSVTSIRLAVMIYKKFGLHISSKDVLDGGTILKVEEMLIASLLESKDSPSESSKELRSSYPLTQTQIGIYTDCLRAGMDAYSIPMLLKLPREIDTEKLKTAVVKAIKAHPSMLCCIHPDDRGDVAMYPVPDMEINVEEETLDTLEPVPTAFEFTESPLFRARIIKCAGESCLFIEAHHIISDGESMTVLVNDIDRAYRGEALTPEKYTAFDLSLDEDNSRKGPVLKEARNYYDSVFRGLSADYLPNPDRSGENAKGSLKHGLSVSGSAVRSLCEKYRITENVLFTGAFALLLARFTGHEDALFATIYNGRNDPRAENLVSMLVKTLPVYANTASDVKLADFLPALDRHLRLLKKNDIYSFADAAHDYGVNANVIFIYQGAMAGDLRLGGLRLQQMNSEPAEAKAELSMEVYSDGEGFRTVIEYNSGKYSEAWISGFADAFDACMNGLIGCETLGDIDICSEEALAEFSDFNSTAWDVKYRPAYRLLEEQTDAHPDRTAVISGNEKLSYLQLDNMASCLARRLLECGLNPGEPVEIILDRTKEIYVAQFGILKAGSPFLFMSPAYPDERISFVTGDAGVRALVTTHAVAESRGEFFATLGVPVLYADEIDPDVKADRLGLEVDQDALAYMIYTSGSTGKPKGVMVKQRGIVNVSDPNPYNPETTGFASCSTISTAVTAFTFDASVMEGVLALANGSTVCIASEENIHNPTTFVKLCVDNDVNAMLATPSFMLNLLDYPGTAEAIKNLRSVVLGGENFTAGLYEKLRSMNPDMNIINGYGPSECTITCSCKFLTSADSITVGTPLANTELYCVDRQNRILPMGALGELTVLGENVGAGYLNREDLTKKSFITINGKPAYKTGDLACITHQGEIEFHGRIDDQIKLRGLRVELGEIESAIEACPGVRKSVVCVFGDEKNKYLAAYYTADRQIEPGEITGIISRTLTDYMVPRIMMQLDSLPLTANGKVDKKALPKPTIQAEKREYVAPESEAEKLLCEEFEDILGLDKVGVTDDFFELGGTSLTATKIAMFAMAHSLPIVYSDVFKFPTVRQLANLAAESSGETKTESAFDYAEIDKVLGRNVRGASTETRPLGNLLLTGATGFLGMHVLNRFLETEKGDVYCLFRKGSADTIELRLQGMYFYYFDESIESLFGTRIHCIDGDITDKACVDSLADVPFDTLFNCAACVKHFTNDDILERVNVKGVENLAELCLKTGKRLIHVSTVSVAGESVDGKPSPDIKLHENELFFGQTLENDYIDTKFRSERVVLDAVTKGLDAKIMRAGNLMPRMSDGEFQINYLTNGFMRRLRGYCALGCIGYSQLSGEMEFSPIDETAAAMLTLAKTHSSLTVFHTNNNHRIFIADVMRAMNEAGLPVRSVDDMQFAARLKSALEDESSNQAVSGLIAYMNRDHAQSRVMLGYDNSFTAEMLYHLGSGWSVTSYDYIVRALKLLKEIGFFDLNA